MVKLLSLLKDNKKIKFVITGLGISMALLLIFEHTKIYSKIPRFADFKKKFAISDKILYSKDGRILNTMRTSFKTRNISWSSLENLNPELIRGLILQEDKRFYSHFGMDVLAMSHAAIDTVFTKKTRGASTITMQLAKLMFKIPSKKMTGKLQQIYYALVLESKWSKKEILEAYLSQVSILGDIQGISTAASLIFQKSPLYLSQVEQSIILKLINRPNLSWDKIEEKVCKGEASCLGEISALLLKIHGLKSNQKSDIQSIAYHLPEFDANFPHYFPNLA